MNRTELEKFSKEVYKENGLGKLITFTIEDLLNVELQLMNVARSIQSGMSRLERRLAPGVNVELALINSLGEMQGQGGKLDRLCEERAVIVKQLQRLMGQRAKAKSKEV